MSQTTEVVNEHCQTVDYAYRLASADEKAARLLRWEYFRQPPQANYPYPLAHLHVNGQLASGGAVMLPKLHIPTRRVPLEMVLWHLIAEWGVKPKQDDWRQLLEDSIEDFERRRGAP